jgi:hypothetical protein
MNNAARDVLVEMIRSYGPQICSTPGSFAMLLRSQCPKLPAETQAIVKILELGITAQIRLVRTTSAEKLEPMVFQAIEGGMTIEEANWAVESWSVALNGPAKGATGAIAQGPIAQQELSPEELVRAENRKQDASTFSKWLATATVAGLLGMLVGLAFLIWHGNHIFRGRLTNGTVVGYQKAPGTNLREECPVVEFFNRQQNVTTLGAVSKYRYYQIGEQVPVVYVPGGSGVVGSYLSLLAGPLVFGGTGLLVVLLSSVALMYLRPDESVLAGANLEAVATALNGDGDGDGGDGGD